MTRDVLADLKAAARARTVLRGLDLRGAKLDGAKLLYLRGDGVRLDEADLAGADLSLAHFMDSDFVGADLRGAKLVGATLWQCKLHEIRGEGLSLHGLKGGTVWARSADLTSAQLTDAELGDSSFTKARLDRAVLDRSRADGASFEGASLAGTSLVGASLVGACLKGADLRGADLSHAVLTDADLRGALLEGAVFAGATLTGARFDGAVPETSGGTPHASRWESLKAYLAANDVASVRALHTWWKGPHELAGQALEAAGPPEARAALADVLLDDDDGFTRLVAVQHLSPELDVPRLVPRLVAMLDAKPVDAPDHPGYGKGKRDLGLFAAYALAERSDDAAALTALEMSLDGKADVQERVAAALAVRALRQEDRAALDRLWKDRRVRVRAGTITGIIRALDEVSRGELSIEPAVLDRAVAILEKADVDAAPAIMRSAKRRSRELLLHLSRLRSSRRTAR